METLKNVDGVRGRLFLIGGAATTCMQVFMRLAADRCAGDKLRVLVVPFASSEPEKAFARTREALLVGEYADAEVVCAAGFGAGAGFGFGADLSDFCAVFLTGGDQSDLVERLGQDGIKALADYYAGGGLIGGTSAGAACMGNTMITGGTHRDLAMAAGLGLTGEVMFDTHFAERGRFARPIVALQTPGAGAEMALGLDEDTAVLIEAAQSCALSATVFGSGQVYVYRNSGIAIGPAGAVETRILDAGEVIYLRR